MAVNRKKQLQNIINEARNELSEIEDAEKTQEHEKYVGRFFKYKNSYSCPETEKDYWWIYATILKTEDCGVRMFSFEIDSYGTFEIKPNEWHVSFPYVEWIEIDKAEYMKAWNSFYAKISKMNKKEAK